MLKQSSNKKTPKLNKNHQQLPHRSPWWGLGTQTHDWPRRKKTWIYNSPPSSPLKEQWHVWGEGGCSNKKNPVGSRIQAGSQRLLLLVFASLTRLNKWQKTAPNLSEDSMLKKHTLLLLCLWSSSSSSSTASFQIYYRQHHRVPSRTSTQNSRGSVPDWPQLQLLVFFYQKGKKCCLC